MRNSLRAAACAAAPSNSALPDDVLHVTVDVGALCTSLDSLRCDPATPQPLMVEASTGECYLTVLLRGSPREMTSDATRYRAADGFVDEIGSNAMDSLSGFQLSAECTLLVPVDDGGRTAMCGYLAFR